MTWTKTGTMPDTVKIALVAKNNAYPERIIAASAPNSGSCAWTVPSDIVVGAYYISIKTQNPLVTGASAFFNIVLAKKPMPRVVEIK